VGQDSEEILKLVREKSDAELDALRLQLAGLDLELINRHQLNIGNAIFR